MNIEEKKLVTLLKRIKSRGHVASVKAEFEAEGTRTDELLRLLDILHNAQLPLTIKVGGCEAVKDLYEARQFGAKFIVAPMIESVFALQKYAQAVHKVFPEEEKAEVDFLFNVETRTAHQIARELAQLAQADATVKGIVFGRSDFTASLGPRLEVTDPGVLQAVLDVAGHARDCGLDYVVGGAVSIATVPDLKRVAEVHLTRFETRKVVFHASALEDSSLSDSLLDAVHFEIIWLLNKSNYYGLLHKEDEARIRVLEERWNVLGRQL